MQTIFEEKEIWNIVDNLKPKFTTARQIKKKDKNNVIAIKIIKQGVNSNLYINIIDKQDLYRSCKTFPQIWS